ncbi:hypothetical protein F5Y10DRAFT_241206 [Nemania abortiva]|nr:hypothetical protein F5Y10DRAFT_241206 [Nemania abortiva]
MGTWLALIAVAWRRRSLGDRDIFIYDRSKWLKSVALESEKEPRVVLVCLCGRRCPVSIELGSATVISMALVGYEKVMGT